MAITPPSSSKLASSAAAKKPDGWWSAPSPDFEGSREGVLKAIAAATDVPTRWKRNLTEEIGELPPEFNYVIVDVHVSCNLSPDGKTFKRIYDCDITGKVKL